MTQLARGDLQHGLHRSGALDLLVDGVQHSLALGLVLCLFILLAVLQHSGDLWRERREQASFGRCEAVRYFSFQDQGANLVRTKIQEAELQQREDSTF